MRTVAALFVQSGGVYCGVPGVEPWGLPERDARHYQGPHPVVAHPPCARWGRFSRGSPLTSGNYVTGDDGGCFASALTSVRYWGGVLEHPAASKAFAWYGLGAPPRSGEWVRSADGIGWCVCVDQGHYGHRTAKATWLYCVGTDRPEFARGKIIIRLPIETDASDALRRKRIRAGVYSKMGRIERARTPVPFRDVLIATARTVGVE